VLKKKPKQGAEKNRGLLFGKKKKIRRKKKTLSVFHIAIMRYIYAHQPSLPNAPSKRDEKWVRRVNVSRHDIGLVRRWIRGVGEKTGAGNYGNEEQGN